MNNLTVKDLLWQLTTQISNRNEEHINRIFETLKEKTGENITSDVDKWVEWYLKSQAKELDKEAVEIGYKLFKANRNIEKL